MNLIDGRNKALHLGMIFIFTFSFSGIYLLPIQQHSPGEKTFKTFLPLLFRPPELKTFLPLLFRPPEETVFGVYLDAPGPDNGLAKMAAAGASWVRVPFYWSQVESSAGQFAWQNVDYLDEQLKAILASHINIILYINDTPAWALKAGYVCGAVSQDRFSDMATFMTDLVQRYSAPPFNVKYYELWNEPDTAPSADSFLGCWGDPNDPQYFGGGYYGEMLKVAYPAIKAANSQAQVLFGGLLMDCDADNIALCTSSADSVVNLSIARFFEGALADGAGPDFDGVSFHGYDYSLFEGNPPVSALGQYSNLNRGTSWDTTGPVSLAKAAYLREVLARYGVTGKYLMNTELALLCGRTGMEAACTNPDHESTVSAYIVQGMAEGKADGLTAMIWFSVAGWRGSGLLDSSLNPLPPYSAYQVARSMLGEATYVGPVTGFNGVTGYEFNSNGRRLWVLWSITATGNPQNITLSSMPLTVSDMYGNALPIGMTLGVGLEPIYVELN